MQIITTGNAYIGNDLQVGEAGTIVEFDEGKSFRITPGANPTGHTKFIRGLFPMQDMLDQRTHVTCYRRHAGLSKRLVTAVAKRSILALLALTPVDGLFFLHFVLHRSQSGSLVGAVTEWWVGRAATGTPEVGAGFNFQG